MSLPSAEFADAAKWQAIGLRLTAFQRGLVPEQDWWRRVVGEDPDNVASKNKGLRHESNGTTERGVLSLSIDPVRINWNLTPVSDTEEMFLDGVLPTLGKFNEALDGFVAYMTKWVEFCPPIKRLAIGAVLHLPAEDEHAAYLTLNEFLDEVQIDPASSDFQYRINRRRESRSGIPGLQLNRLSTWSAVKWQVKLEGQDQPIDPPVHPMQFACRLELDINTGVSFGKELPHDRLQPLLSELATLGLEIAAHGDIR